MLFVLTTLECSYILNLVYVIFYIIAYHMYVQAVPKLIITFNAFEVQYIVVDMYTIYILWKLRDPDLTVFKAYNSSIV